MPNLLKINASHRRLLMEIRREQPVSRAELSRLTGINTGPVTQLTRDLLLAGLVTEGERLKGQRGQPALPLSINPGGGLSFGVGLTPGAVHMVAIDFTGSVVDEARAPLQENQPEAVIQIVQGHIDKMVRKARLIERERILGVGFAMPGFFFSDPSRMRMVEDYGEWRRHELTPMFARLLDLPVWMENDATAAALAQAYAEETKQARCLALLLINYGIGGGIIVEGRPLRGAHGNAGEIGTYYPLDQPRPSGSDLLRALRQAGVEVDALACIDPADPRCAEPINRWTKRAGKQLAAVVEAAWGWLDPDMIVVAGALPLQTAQALADSIPRELFNRHPERPRPAIVPSSIGENIVAIGAAHLPLHAAVT